MLCLSSLMISTLIRSIRLQDPFVAVRQFVIQLTAGERKGVSNELISSSAHDRTSISSKYRPNMKSADCP